MSPSRLAYSLLLYLLLPLILLRLVLKSRKNKNYRLRIPERLGKSRHLTSKKPIIWLHAVSVGEAIAAKPLIEQLLEAYPHYSLLVTSTTPTGSDTVTRLFGEKILHSYFPYDLPHVVSAFIGTVKPKLLIIVETEIWPNLYASCSQKNIPILMVNARLSKRSTAQYQRIKPLIQETLSHTALISVRSREDERHFLSLGAPQDHIERAGNIKFDIAIDHTNDDQVKVLKSQWGNRKVWVAASTHKNEDEIIVAIFTRLKQSIPDLLLILVPRHPERFKDVLTLISTTAFTIQTRSENKAFTSNTDIILGDSMGELLLWYAASDVAFIGGSLVEIGGHNPLEATALGIPVVSGPHTFNFTDIYPPLCTANIAWVEQNNNDITNRLKQLLCNENVDFKQRCRQLMQQHKGSVTKLMTHIKSLL